MSGGCAKKDLVKSEEQIPAVQAPGAETGTPVRKESEPIAETPAREPAVKQETAKEGLAGQPSALESELQKIYFNFDAATLSEEARASLSRNAELLAKNPSLKVTIEGNCDERGSDEYNLALGERRAIAARDYLVNLGVQSDRISIISYGEEKPVDPGHDEAAWAKNRRDEFVVIK